MFNRSIGPRVYRRFTLPYAPPLVLKASGPANLVLRQGYLPNVFPPGVIPASFILVGWHFVGEDPSATRVIGTFKSGSVVTVPYNPGIDKDFVIRTMGLNSSGKPDVHQWSDAEFRIVTFNRNTGTPVISQFSTATTTGVSLIVGGFNQYVIGRRVTSATNAGFTTGVVIGYFDLSHFFDKTAQFFSITATVGTQERWIKVAHSTNGFDVNASWGADSNVLDIVFAGTGGGTGSPGGGDPTPPNRGPIFPL